MTDWANGRSTRLLPRVRRPAGGYAAPTHCSSITLVETWEGFAGQFGNIECVFEMMVPPADRDMSVRSVRTHMDRGIAKLRKALEVSGDE